MCSLIEQKGRGREDVLSVWLLELRPWSSALGLGLTPGSQGFGPRLQLWNQFSWVSNFQTADFIASQLCEQISYNKQHTHTHTHTSPICSLSVENSDAYIIWFLTPLKATQEWMCLLLIPSFRSLWEHKGLQMSFSQALPTVIVDFCGKVFINTNSIIE